MDRRSFIVLATSGTVAACSWAPHECELPPPADIANHKLARGDVLRIMTFGIPELSGEFSVDETEMLEIPLGHIPAWGSTVGELENAIEKELKERGGLVNPRVIVELLESSDFYIIGEVQEPGGYRYFSGLTVANAVARAGGLTYSADQQGITVQRSGREYCARPNIGILPYDVITVPEQFQ